MVCNIVDEYIEVDNSLSADDDVLKHSKLFIRDALTFWVFSDAVRYEDVGLMWLIYSFWLFMFRGAGCHNYGNKGLGNDSSALVREEQRTATDHGADVAREQVGDTRQSHSNGSVSRA